MSSRRTASRVNCDSRRSAQVSWTGVGSPLAAPPALPLARPARQEGGGQRRIKTSARTSAKPCSC
eukprot:3010463-Pyramimonas_sp.AAC.1